LEASIVTKATVFRRDRWRCRWCGRPVFLPRSVRLLDFELESVGASERYYHPNWERSKSPLLDALGAIACQVGSDFSDAPDSFATSCNWCFIGGRTASPSGPISEDKTWDGFATVFTVLAQRYKSELTNDDRGWVKALS
jgi:hypothetical protein